MVSHIGRGLSLVSRCSRYIEGFACGHARGFLFAFLVGVVSDWSRM